MSMRSSVGAMLLAAALLVAGCGGDAGGERGHAGDGVSEGPGVGERAGVDERDGVDERAGVAEGAGDGADGLLGTRPLPSSGPAQAAAPPLSEPVATPPSSGQGAAAPSQDAGAASPLVQHARGGVGLESEELVPEGAPHLSAAQTASVGVTVGTVGEGGAGAAPDGGASAALREGAGAAPDGGAGLAPADGGWHEEVFRDGSRVCRAVAGPEYIGAVCTSNTDGRPIHVVIEEILDGDPLPECWHQALTDAELRSLGLKNGEEGARWFWVRCLHGVDPESYEVDDDGAHVSLQYRRLPEEEVIELTDPQQRLVDFLSGNHTIPAPVLGVSPHPVAVAHQDVSFYNAGAELGEHEVVVSLADMGVTMRARVVGLEVATGDGATVACPGNGHRARPEQRPSDAPQACWHSYSQSSLGLPQDAFDSWVSARWRVEINRGHGWEDFHAFDKVARHRVQVNEIQAIVVP